MTTSPVKQAHINAVAWRACDTFRGVVDPSEYKNYVLVFLFWKYLSDVWKDHRARLLTEYNGDQERVARRLSRERFIMPADGDFDSLYLQRNEPNVGERINMALEAIEEANKAKLENVLTVTDFNSETKLGQTRDRNARLRHLFEDFNDPKLDLRPSRVGDEDIIGNTYEYLIERFASDAGKKAGEFYTPRQVSRLLARLLAPQPGETICDPACGSGSLLIRLGNEVGSRDFALFGQESNGSTWALCRMNMFLHGMDGARIEWGDTMRNPKLLAGDRALMRFDVVAANPPFSLEKWGYEEALHDPFGRFRRGVPPRGRGDWGFISHMVETATAGRGRVGVVVPHGVLFRGAAEGKIRRRMVEENLLEAVIGLPATLFFGTGIPAAILLFNKAKTRGGDVLFVDASRGYEEGKNQSRLRESDVARIVAAHRNFEGEPKFAHRATVAEIAENDFNLNIPRYVDTFEEEGEIDLAAVQGEIEGLETELADVRREMAACLKELGV